MRRLLESLRLRAQFAIDLFVYRIGRELGSVPADIGSLDALILQAASASTRP
jgi:acetate kinase